jgi:phage terminase Nu1 subunit (DNA packaging protein)
MSDLQPVTVPVGTLAQVINIGVVRIQQLAKLGVVVKSARGQYDLYPSVTGYVRYLQEGNSGASGSDEDGEVSGDDYHKHRARLYKARADAAEMEASLLRGKLHDALKVEKVWTDMIASARAKLLALPTKSAGKVKGVDDTAEIKSILEEQIHEALNELSDYDPDRVAIDPIPQDQSEVEATAEADGEPMG